MWNHDWGRPSVVAIRRKGRSVLWTARQTCEVCGTLRNPFNRVITYFPRVRGCKQLMESAEPKDWSAELAQVRWVLDAHKADGEDVDHYHTGRKVRAPTSPELPLPYKD